MKNLPLILAIDFDGLLVEDQFPEIGQPNLAIIDVLLNLQSRGAKLILWTCRHGEYLSSAVEFCFLRGLVFDAINENLPEVQKLFNIDTRKVFAHYYLDDKNLEGDVKNCHLRLPSLHPFSNILTTE